VLVVLGLAGTLLWRTSFGAQHLAVVGKPTGHWWRVLTGTFLYDNTGYAFVALATIAVFGWLLERRHGPLPVLLLFLLGGIGGTAATAAAFPVPVVMGAGGAALAMVIAWALPDAVAARSGESIDGDLIGAAVVTVVVALMPLAAGTASWVADGVGVIAGLAVGLPLARVTLRG
jgi:membrane associated rhomboid family serine protease